MPKIGLALGSGGLRGMAHLGVLQVLEEEGVSVDYVAGCSIGSLIGALYCCGHEANMLMQLTLQLKKRHILDFIVPTMGLFSGDKILEIMALLTKRCDFADLKIPLNIVATELHEGKRVILSTGLVSEAVRASVSVPGVFVPHRIGQQIFVDGAVLDPIPVDAAFSMGADIVVAVDLSHAMTDFPLLNIFDVIIKSLDIMERELNKNRQYQENTIFIQPKVGHIAPSSFDHIEESVELGRAAAREMLPELRAMLEKWEAENASPA